MSEPVLSEQTTVDTITVRADGRVEVRRRTTFLRDGIARSTSYLTTAYQSGSDIGDEDPLVVAVANAAWNVVAVPELLDTRDVILLFTVQEFGAIHAAIEAGVEAGQYGLLYYWSVLTAKSDTNRLSPRFRAALSMLVAGEILTQTRADRIAAGLPPLPVS